ncbi:hypothetical protein BT96DRAFT_996695 [Gymnopus androsaceus JB14]|uniref:BCNT-C domain-containing protein n=1 Tax=Gymnopus androsaceus JB14 TaxID=1447944 RepID=A0A6A4HDK1_9AGAR|nr:hypothetical protein BT96DRAFT_996695 [Gymnopus androsaceus JB14]
MPHSDSEDEEYVPDTKAESSSSSDGESGQEQLDAKRPRMDPEPEDLETQQRAQSRNAPKKLTTLEKSAMDWRSHLSTADNDTLKDELEANRKQGGGGYLEKVEFLDRVSERRESLLDASKSGKRRRG